MTKYTTHAALAFALSIISAAFIFSTANLAIAATISSPSASNQAAILGSASVELTETNSALRTSGRLSISDADSAQTFVARKNVAGVNGTFSVDATGRWTYVANSSLDRLNVGQSVSDSFTVSSADGTTTTVQVTINGSNDAAVLGAANVVLKETNEVLSTNGTLSIRDVDSPETFVAQSNVAGVSGTFNIDSAGRWTYVANSTFDELNVGQSVSDSFTVASADGTTTAVKVTINGTNDPAVLGSANEVLTETNEVLSASGTLSIRDVDNPATFVAQNNVRGKNGIFNIDAAGVWTYVTNGALDRLSAGQSVTDSFTASSADGTTTTVQVTVNGTNDPATPGSAAVVLDETNAPLKVSGKLSIRDVDSPETFVAQSNMKGQNGTFSIDTSGRWNYVANSAFDELNAGQSVSDSFTVSSADSTTTSVQVTINGNNDAAVLGTANVVLTETDAPLSATGTLSIRDVDSPATFVAQSNVSGKYGTFSIDSAGAWTYVANSAFDELNVGQNVTDSFTVASAEGATTTVKVTINGSNDAAILGAASVVLTETNEVLNASGALSIRDADNSPVFVARKNFKGDYGTFSINTEGAWTYVTNGALDRLSEGQSVTDIFTVSSADGTTTTVQVTINGTNDPAVLGSADVALKETNEVLMPTGKLSIRDVDSPQTFVPQNNVKGENGTFSIETSGRWAYIANSAFDELNAGQSASDSFTVSSADGTTATVKVTINGNNDPAVMDTANVVLIETDVPLSTAGTLGIRDPDSPATFVSQSNVSGKYGTFSIDSAGAWTYVANSAFDNLNVSQSVKDSFTVSSADGTTTTVKVTINGTNDPAILSSEAVVLDETNVPLKPAGTLSIRDVDNPETFVAQSNVKGENGSFSIDKSGRWTYVANSAFDRLGAGQSVSDSFTVSSSDGTTTTVKVTINGTNDAAVLGSANVALKETNDTLSTSGALSIRDVDSPATFVAQSNAKGENGIFNIDTAGAWSYVTNGALDWIREGMSVSDSFTVSSADGTTTTVKVTINGTNDPAILSTAEVALDETNEPLKPSGTLSIRDVDSPETFVEQSNVKGKHGYFSIDKSGLWTYVANSAFDELNAGQSVSDHFKVTSADGTTTSVQVTINGTNDPAILSSATVALDETNAPLHTSGTLSIRDVDSPETFESQTNVAGANGIFNIDAAGRWSYSANSAFDELNVGRSLSDSFTVSSADGTTTTVKVTINGTNDPAILSSAYEVLKETNETLKTGGNLTIRDVDNPLTFVPQGNVAGANGTFSIDAAGAWTYVTNGALDWISEGKNATDSFTVSSEDGTTTTVKITINGTNDPAILSSVSLVLDETNAPLKPTGILSIRDVDSPETFVAQSKVKGKNGTFSIETSGRWTYVANSAFDELNVGLSVSDSFAVSSADGTTTTVQVKINGTNDPAVMSAPRVSLTETNEALGTSGQLSIRDVDSPATFVARKNVRGKNGTFTVDSVGAWTYMANYAFDDLGVGQSASDNFTVASADGTTTSVKVTINGTNDPASLSAAKVTLTETNSPRSTGGRLSIVDVDSPMVFVAQRNVAGTNGTFNIDTSGRWTYVANSAFNELDAGQSVKDSFVVISKDGSATSVQVTIEGSEESRYKGIWIGGKIGINRSSLNDMTTRSAVTYGIEEGATWELGVLQLGAYGSLESNNTATGPVNYSSQIIGVGAKLAVPSGKWLPYIKLGYARTNGSDAANDISASHVNRGLGIEYRFTDKWSVAGEYSSSSGNTVYQDIESKLRNKNYTIGFNYYFGVPVTPAPPPAPAPVLAPQPEAQVVFEPAPPAARAPEPVPEPAPSVPETWKTLMEDKPVRIEGTNFAAGSSKLNLVSGKEPMKDVVDFVAKHPDANLEVIGYSDSTGSEELNKKLSLARAKSVKKYLVDSGVAADRITTKGEGIANPVGDNKTAEGRALNRRVEIRSVIRVEKKVPVTQPVPAAAPKPSPKPAPVPAPMPPASAPAFEPAFGPAPAPAPAPAPVPAPSVPAPAFEPAFGPAPAPALVPAPSVPAPAFEPAFGPTPPPVPAPSVPAPAVEPAFAPVPAPKQDTAPAR